MRSSRRSAERRDQDDMLGLFLKPPVYQTSYGMGYGTLYTAIYRPVADTVELVWPGARWQQTCDEFLADMRTFTVAE